MSSLSKWPYVDEGSVGPVVLLFHSMQMFFQVIHDVILYHSLDFYEHPIDVQ